MRRVHADLGKELACSTKIREVIANHGYTLESTAAKSSFQNSKAEHPHRTLGNMMCSIFKESALDRSFCVDALLHAVYLCNCLPHAALGMTPCKKMSLKKSNSSH